MVSQSPGELCLRSGILKLDERLLRRFYLLGNRGPFLPTMGMTADLREVENVAVQNHKLWL